MLYTDPHKSGFMFAPVVLKVSFTPFNKYEASTTAFFTNRFAPKLGGNKKTDLLLTPW